MGSPLTMTTTFCARAGLPIAAASNIAAIANFRHRLNDFHMSAIVIFVALANISFDRLALGEIGSRRAFGPIATW
jgi:hypothetical protein